MFKEDSPSTEILQSFDRIHKELLPQGNFSKGTDFPTFQMTPPTSLPDLLVPNTFNAGGYRTIVGLPFLEVDIKDSKVEIVNSCIFFESYLPFISFFREVLELIYSDLRVQKLVVFNKFYQNCSDFFTPFDYITFGAPVTERFFHKMVGDGISPGKTSFYKSLKFKNSSFQGSEMLLQILFHVQNISKKPIKLTTNLETRSLPMFWTTPQHVHPVESLRNIPKTMQLETILLVLGAVLQEGIVFIHSKFRNRGFELVSFILGVISPLIWPFCVVPLLKKNMEHLTDCPVPLICVIEEEPVIFNQRWKNRPSSSESSIHIQLETNKVIGSKVPLDFLKTIVNNKGCPVSFSGLNSIWTEIHLVKPESNAKDNENLYEHSRYAYVCLDFVRNIQKLISSLFIDHLIESDFDFEKSKFELIDLIHLRSPYPAKALEPYLKGQIFQQYLDNLSEKNSPVT